MARGGKPSSTLSVFSRAARAGSKRRNENKRRKKKKRGRGGKDGRKRGEEKKGKKKKEGGAARGRAFQHVPRTRTSLKHEAPDIL